MASLPLILRSRFEDFRPAPRYLKTDPATTEKLTARYKAGSQDIVVGISWRSGNRATGSQRSAELELWSDVFAVDGMRFVNLQYGDCSEDLRALKETKGIDVFDDAEVNALGDLDMFASQVDACDIVVSIDNSTIHMAAALGKPTLAALPFEADWRWFYDREDTPWYRSLRLYRQSEPGDWAPVFERLSQDLKKLGSGAPDTATPVAPGPRTGRKLLLGNDTANWYHWGCTGTSTAIRMVAEALDFEIASLPINQVYGLTSGPGSIEAFDDPTVFDRFRRQNAMAVAAVERADTLVINGEGTLHGRTAQVVNLLYLAYAAKRHIGVPVQIINHSCFPDDKAHVTDPVSLELYGKVYRALDFISVREHLSYGILTRMGIEPELAFDSLPIYIAETFDRPAETAGDYIAVAGCAAVQAMNLDGFCAYLADLGSQGLPIRILVGARAFPAA
ncbi:MAG: polysaccharide pyruvyl transferase family protein, partial [Pirellulales bacterium]|nr:polysaccharide pyruvyl transferase family protein [Pirellulales bacterium]